MNGKIF